MGSLRRVIGVTGRARLVSLSTGTAPFEAPESEAHDARNRRTRRRNGAMWERKGVKPCIEGGRIRQYTAAAGAPMVYGFEAFECGGQLEFVLRGRALGCIARASALEGRIRSKYEAAGERGHSYEAMEGRFRTRSGRSNMAGGRDLLLLAVY